MHHSDLDRREILPRLFPDQDSWLFVSGLAGASKDMAALTDDGAHLFTMAGTMGAAVPMGLGMALSAPDRKVAVVTGDGELLMGIGALVTVGQAAPANLAIVCLDNGLHGETGGQAGMTSGSADLAAIARGAGIADTLAISRPDQLDEAAALLARTGAPRFVHARVQQTPPSAYRRDFDAAACRLRFRAAAVRPPAA